MSRTISKGPDNKIFFRANISSRFGPLSLFGTYTGLSRLHFEKYSQPVELPQRPLKADSQLSSIANKIKSYLEGDIDALRSLKWIPDVNGTPFQKQVWERLRRIPFGQTRSYGDIALKLGNSNLSRAVGMACHANPLPILIPCHRVIGQSGSLGGFALGTSIKKTLLRLENPQQKLIF